jgi:hypothetical protein
VILVGFKSVLANATVNRMRHRIETGPVSLPGDLLSPKHVLVCLPGGLRELTLVKQYLPVIRQLFRSADITLLAMPRIKVTDIYPRKGYQLLTPSDEQLTWTGLPKKSYLRILEGYKFDMVIDMNLVPSVFTSTILLAFPRAVRIGRGNHLGSPFYNVEIKTKYLRDEKNIYRSLLETLGEMIDRTVDISSPSSGTL